MARDRVYIAGPYSEGDAAMNVRSSLAAAEELIAQGFAPFVPHLTHFWHLVFPHPHEYWLELDCEFLRACSAVLRLPGGSAGAEEEVRLAESLGIPVFYDLDSLVAHFAEAET